MKSQAIRMLDDTKQRAYRQINYALHYLANRGDAGTPFNWWDSDHQNHETTSYYQHFYNFQLGDRQGETDIPLFFNSTLREWDSVMNMPAEDLCQCADYFIHDIMYKKLNK